MSKTDFDKFIKRQQAKKLAEHPVDWDQQREEWLRYLNQLYKDIEEFMKTYISNGDASCVYQNITLNEECIGSYVARQMVLHIGLQQVTFTPIGTLLIGTKGRVDVSGPAGKARLSLNNKKVSNASQLIRVTVEPTSTTKKTDPDPIDWVWKIISPPPQIILTDLTEETFFEMILEVVNA